MGPVVGPATRDRAPRARRHDDAPDPYPVGRGAPSPTSPTPTVSFDDALDLAVKVDAVKYLECTFASGVTTGAKLLFEEALRLAVEEKAAEGRRLRDPVGARGPRAGRVQRPAKHILSPRRVM